MVASDNLKTNNMVDDKLSNINYQLHSWLSIESMES